MLVNAKEIKVGDLVKPYKNIDAVCLVLDAVREDRSTRLFLQMVESGYVLPIGIKFSHRTHIEKVGA